MSGNFDGRDPRYTIKAMFAVNEGDEAMLDEAFDAIVAAERARIRAEVGRLGGLEYGSADSGLRYLNGDFIDRVAVLALLEPTP